MAEKLKNCWEIMKCGREPNGEKCHEQGICPAATDGRLNGIHGGRNGGRACWVVVGTLCKGEVQGTFAAKMANCGNCDFYEAVRRQQGTRFVLSPALLNIIAKK